MKNVERTMNKIMVLKGGSPAIHQLGNIGRKEDEYIRVYAEDEDDYVGVFEEGFGFIDVRFKKDDCRQINNKEFNFLSRQVYVIGGMPMGYVTIDRDGNII